MGSQDIIPKGEWLASIKKKRRKQWTRAAIGTALAMGVWLGATGSVVGCWYLVFHELRLGPALAAFLIVENVILFPLAKYVPVFPMKGKDPEEIAAEEFLNGPPR